LQFELHDQPDIYISDGIRRDRAWEPLETELVTRLTGAGTVFVDCGANLGWYTVIAAARGAQVVAFEPERGNLALLRRNVARNHLDHLVEIHGSAVGDRRGRSELSLSADNLGDHRLTSLAGRDHVDVEVVSLDDVLHRRTVDVIKLDTQGSEVRILDGADTLLRRFERDGTALIVEFWPQGLVACGSTVDALLDHIDRLVRSGFQCFEVSERLERPRPTCVGDLRELALGIYSPEAGGHTNVLLVRADHVERVLDPDGAAPFAPAVEPSPPDDTRRSGWLGRLFGSRRRID
jgi:FkbM family methyltransferase